MSLESDAIQTLTTEFIKTVKLIVSRSSFDRTKKGRVIGHIGGKYYEVQIDGHNYKAYSPIFPYDVNDIVYVKVAENNYNNLIIECAIK